MDPSQNIWNMYGLKGNPFSTDPLTPYGTELPIKDAFVGREKEIARIKKNIYSNSTTRQLVYGEIGVGKTSFVNYIKKDLIDDKYFTTLSELGIQYNWAPEDLMFHTISNIYTTIDRFEGTRKKFNSELMKKLDIIFGTRRGEMAGGGVQAVGMGFNAQEGKTYGVPTLNSATLKILFQDVVDELKRIGYKGVVIHYNNLELILEKGEDKLKILNGIREFLQVTGVHFFFVSDKTLYELFQQIPRVEDIFQTPTLLDPFDIIQTKEIIKKRIDYLKIAKATPVIPFDDESFQTLFDLYEGNLRGILKSLDCAITDATISNPVIVDKKILGRTLYKFAKNRFLSKFSKDDSNTLKILRRILEKRETTNKLLAEHFNILPQNVSSSLSRLRDIGAIRLSREEGRSRFYVPSQEAIWLLLDSYDQIDGIVPLTEW